MHFLGKKSLLPYLSGDVYLRLSCGPKSRVAVNFVFASYKDFRPDT